MTKLKILLALLSAALLPQALSAATATAPNPAAGVPIPFRWLLLADSAPSPSDRPPADHSHDDHGPGDHKPGDHGPADDGPSAHGPSDHGPAAAHGPADHGPSDHHADHGPGDHTSGARGQSEHGSTDSKSAASGDESSHGARHGRGFSGWSSRRGPSDQADSDQQSDGPRSRGFAGRPGANSADSNSGDPGARWRGGWDGPNAGGPMNRSSAAGPMNRDGGRDGEPSRFASPTNPRGMGPGAMPDTMAVRRFPGNQANTGPMSGMSMGGPGSRSPYTATFTPMPAGMSMDPSAMQRMIQTRGQMQRQMQTGDDDLDHLVDEMNGSVGERKVEAMAAIINRLMQERKSMRRGLASMGPGMGGPETARPDTSRARFARSEARAEVASDDEDDDDSDARTNVQADPSSMWRQMLDRRIAERRSSAEGNGPQFRGETNGPRTAQKVQAGGPRRSMESDEDDDDDN